MIKFFLAVMNLLRLLKAHPPAEVHEQVTGTDAAPPVKRRSTGPTLRKPRETVFDWFKRKTGQ